MAGEHRQDALVAPAEQPLRGRVEAMSELSKNNSLELIPLYEIEEQSYCVYMNLSGEKKTNMFSQNAAVGEMAYQ